MLCKLLLYCIVLANDKKCLYMSSIYPTIVDLTNNTCEQQHNIFLPEYFQSLVGESKDVEAADTEGQLFLLIFSPSYEPAIPVFTCHGSSQNDCVKSVACCGLIR